MRVAPGIALIDDEVDIYNMESLAETLEKVERVGVDTEEKVAQPDPATRFI